MSESKNRPVVGERAPKAFVRECVEVTILAPFSKREVL